MQPSTGEEGLALVTDPASGPLWPMVRVETPASSGGRRPWIWTTRPRPSGARKPLLRARPQAGPWLGVPRSAAPAGVCRQGPSGEHGARRRGGSRPGSPTPLPPPSSPSSRALRPAASDDTAQVGSCARVRQPPPPAMRSLPHSAPGDEGPCLACPPQGGASSRNSGSRAQARDKSGAAAPHQHPAPPPSDAHGSAPRPARFTA